MDIAMERRHLELARRHVAQGEHIIAAQEKRITNLDLKGHDTTQSRRLLDNFHAMQAQHIEHRDRIIAYLAAAGIQAN